MAASGSTRALGRALMRRGTLPAALQQQQQQRRGAAGSSPAASAAADAATTSTFAQEYASARPFEEMPGPSAIPILGNWWRFVPGIGPWGKKDFLDVHRELHAKYGNIVKINGMLKKDLVIIFEPADVEKVYRSEGPWPKRTAFESLRYYRQVMHKDKFEGAYGLLTSDDEDWQSFRRRVSPPMLQPRSVALYTAPVDQVAGEFVERLRELRNQQGVLPDDSVNWFFRWSLESIAVVALDTRLGCLERNLPQDSEPQMMIDAVQGVFNGTYELEMRPALWDTRGSAKWKNFVKSVDVFAEVSNKYINEAMVRIKSKVGEEVSEDAGELSVLERLLLTSDNPRVATTMALDTLFAGVDTTSYSTAALLYLLSKNPDKQEILFQELRSLMPSRGTPITMAMLNEMKYLKACIKESMRMKPVAIGQLRENQRDDFVLSNYRIPKGIDLVMSLRVMCEEDKNFPRATEFIPERWLKGHEMSTKSSPFISLPFGFGPRSCVGKRFAELEMDVLNAKLLRNFRVEYPGEATFQTKILHVMASPMNFRLIDRE